MKSTMSFKILIVLIIDMVIKIERAILNISSPLTPQEKCLYTRLKLVWDSFFYLCKCIHKSCRHQSLIRSSYYSACSAPSFILLLNLICSSSESKVEHNSYYYYILFVHHLRSKVERKPKPEYMTKIEVIRIESILQTITWDQVQSRVCHRSRA